MKRGGQVIYAGPLGRRSCKLVEYFEVSFLSFYPPAFEYMLVPLVIVGIHAIPNNLDIALSITTFAQLVRNLKMELFEIKALKSAVTPLMRAIYYGSLLS